MRKVYEMIRGNARVVFSLIVAGFGLGMVMAVLSAPTVAEESAVPRKSALSPTKGAKKGALAKAALPSPAVAGLDIRSMDTQTIPATAPLTGTQKRALLTVDVGLQMHLMARLKQYGVPYGSVVAIMPASGRVLAYVSHSSANPGAPDLARDVTPPAASVFKVITRNSAAR